VWHSPPGIRLEVGLFWGGLPVSVSAQPGAILVACCGAIATVSFTLAGPALCMPAMARELGFGILMGTGRFLTSALSGRLGTRWLLVLSAGLCTVCLASMALPLGAVYQIGCLSLVGFGVACFWPTLLAVAGDRFPQAGASMFSVLSAAGAFGCAAAPVAIGWIANACDSLAPAMIALAVAPAVILVASFHVTRRRAGKTDTHCA